MKGAFWIDTDLRLGEEILRLEPGNRLVLEYQARNRSNTGVTQAV